MIRLGVISDVHGNLPALETALDFLERWGVEHVLCCGDVVGYGPWPNECAALVRERGAACVRGNHDGAAIGALKLGHFSGTAAAALRWTQKVLDSAAATFLRSCPLQLPFEDLRIVHASPRDPVWEYVTDPQTAWPNFYHFEERLCFFGHSHLPTVFVLRDDRVAGGRVPGEQALALEPGARYLINPGSVGQPRDGDPRLALAIYERDGAQAQVRFHRLDYPVARVAPAVREAGLPLALYNRLLVGR